MKSSARVSDANADEERCDEEHIVNWTLRRQRRTIEAGSEAGT
jgi:hypothetical protein